MPVKKKKTPVRASHKAKKVSRKTVPAVPVSEEIRNLLLQQEQAHLDPDVPHVPPLPDVPPSVGMGICRHCHLLPAAAYELVLVFVCLVFSLSAVLLASVTTVQEQQQIIQTLQQRSPFIYASR